MAANHAVKYNVPANLLAGKSVNFFDMVCLNYGSSNCRSQHYQVGLKDTVQGFIPCKEIGSVFLFLSKLDSCFTNSEIRYKYEQKGGEESDIKANYL